MDIQNFTGPTKVMLYFNAIEHAPQSFALPPPPPAVKHIPPVSQLPDDIEETGQPSLIVLVLVPIASVILISLVIFAALNAWKHYRKRPEPKPYDCEFVYEEQEPLKPVNKIKGLDLEMQIIQEPDTACEKKRDESLEKERAKNDAQNVTSEKSRDNIEQKREKDANRCTVVTIPDDDVLERPKTLKFLAASVAFQYSTVAAVQRLPYTPDPDLNLCVDGNAVTPFSNGETQDRLTPLIKPKRKMKPRGLLERRGSNVALTISLRSNDKNNSSNTAIVNTKSPKPLAYLQKASSPLTPEELHEKSCDTLRLQQEFWEIPMNHPSEKHFNVPGHGTKNRYRTILPNDHSRVKLFVEEGGDPLSSYINANYIRDCTDLPAPNEEENCKDDVSSPVLQCDASFIATQGPMTNTMGDFWRMIWQEQTSSIVMITKLKERKEKCAQYLPLDVNDRLSYDDIIIKVTGMKKFEHFTVRSLEISRGKDTRQLRHFWYTTWMDHETPEKTRGLLELVQEVSIWNKSAHGPVVVHCSAGIGRTGCYIAVTVGCQQLMKIGKTDILRLVSQMRLDRGGMIQTWEQYQFVHQALSRYGRILAGENVTTPSTTGSIRSPPCRFGKVGGSIKKQSSLERPSTPKHSRSLSETNLPSPKGRKFNSKNSASSNFDCQEKLSSDHKRYLKIEGPADLCPPKSGIVKSASSPTIRSPFGRLCLQTKDLNASGSPGSADKGKESGNLLKDNVETSSKTNGFTFNFQPPVPSPSMNNSNNKCETPTAKPSNSNFSFTIPTEDSPNTVTKTGNSRKSPTRDTTPQSSKTPPATNGRFFFPFSER